MTKQNVYFWIILGAIGLFLGMPNPLFYEPFLVLVYPASLYMIARVSSSPFRYGMICGLLGSSASMYFIAVTMHVYGNLPYILAIPCSFVLGAYLGLYAGIFTFIMRYALYLPIFLRGFCALVTWYLCELARAYLFTGFPWLSLSSAFVPMPAMIQGASFIGAFGLSGVFVFICVLFVDLLYNNSRDKRLGNSGQHEYATREPKDKFLTQAVCAVFITSGFLYALYFAGNIRLKQDNTTYTEIALTRPDVQKIDYRKQHDDPNYVGEARHMLIIPHGDMFHKLAKDTPENLLFFTVVQGNVSQAVKWDPAFQAGTVKKYLRLSTEALELTEKYFIEDFVKSPFAQDNALEYNTLGHNVLEESLYANAFFLWPETAMPFYFQTFSSLSAQIRDFVKPSLMHDFMTISSDITPEISLEISEIKKTESGRPSRIFQEKNLLFGGAGMRVGWQEGQHVQSARENSKAEENSKVEENSINFTSREMTEKESPFIYDPSVHTVDAFYNRLFFLQGEELSFYDKEHLVPFGEYVPKIPFVPALFTDLLQGLDVFQAGKNQELFRIIESTAQKNGLLLEKPDKVRPQDLENLESKPLRLFSSLICYEAIFPDMAQDDVAQGSQLFVNVSNDAWYDRTSASEQHLYLSAMRAVEQKRFLVRAGNTGISAFVDDYGRIMGQTPIFEDASISSFVLLRTEKTVFFYISRYLPLIAFTIFFIFCISMRRLYKIRLREEKRETLFQRKYINKMRKYIK